MDWWFILHIAKVTIVFVASGVGGGGGGGGADPKDNPPTSAPGGYVSFSIELLITAQVALVFILCTPGADRGV